MKTILGITMVWIALGFTIYHHGWSNYDQKNKIDFSGEILESTYENPHGMATVKADDGKTWEVVLAPPSRMQSRGLEKEMLSKGIVAKIEGYPHKEKDGEMRAERITIDEQTFELR